MPDLLTAAISCAVALTGLPEPVDQPVLTLRELTPAERANTNRREDARARFAWMHFPPEIIAPVGDWPALVHEACHFAQYRAGYPFDEVQCEEAERGAAACRAEGK